jgi:hypothetical protein
MREILVTADGVVAKTFIHWLEKNRVLENKFTVVYYNDSVKNDNKNIDFIKFDPTSFVKLSTVLSSTYSDIFIIMANKTDTKAVYENIRKVNQKVHIVLYDRWGLDIDDNNLIKIDANELLANHLFDQIPDVPVYAKNVGLGQGEVMEVLVPLGSSYSYRYIGSIAQRKFSIVGIYRNSKLLLAQNNMIIKPNDTLLLIGKPKVLENVFYAIKQKGGQFPAPYGKDVYLALNTDLEVKTLRNLINQALFLKNSFDTNLIVRVTNPSKLWFLNEEVKTLSSSSVEVLIDYHVKETYAAIEADLSVFNIGLMVVENNYFAQNLKFFHECKKPIFRSGDFELSSIDDAAAIMSNEYDMEAISTTVFDIADRLDLNITLYDYAPDGEFKSKNFTVEHFEALANVHRRKLHIVQEKKNPIIALREEKACFQILPFSQEITNKKLLKIFSTDIKDFFLKIEKHPQIFIPIE